MRGSEARSIFKAAERAGLDQWFPPEKPEELVEWPILISSIRSRTCNSKMGLLSIDIGVDAPEDCGALRDVQLLLHVRLRKRILEIDRVFFDQLVERGGKAPDASPRVNIERRWSRVSTAQGIDIARLLLREEIFDERGRDLFFFD